MDYDSPVSRYSTTIRFVAIAIVLVILLVLGLVFSKRIVANMTSEPTKVATEDKKTKDTNRAEQEKQVAADKAAKDKQAAADKAAADAKAQEAKKQADAKKAQEAAAAQAAAQAAATPNPSGVASTGPSAVASTGPEDAIPYAVAIAALGFAGITFVRSRRDLHRTIEQMLKTTSI